MNPKLSVIIPTHNPNQLRFERTLNGIERQTLPQTDWELLIIDNASENADYIPSFEFGWHRNIKIITEKKLGLTHARLAGINESKGDFLVFVDDDNVLQPNYLSSVIDIFQKHPNLGTIGGKSLPEFEVEPEAWVNQFSVCLALRDFGEEEKIYLSEEGNKNPIKQYPSFSPIGAGMAIQRKAALCYSNSINSNLEKLKFDRTGKSLQSGGDCDINLTLLNAGWGVGYFPQLSLTHLIPFNRLTKDYLSRLNYASSRSWIKVLDHHNIRPWSKISPWTVPFRKLKAMINYQPWNGAEAYIKWRGACGMIEGLCDLVN